MTSPSDAGLQAERTGLAWSRTSLAVMGNAALLALREATAASETQRSPLTLVAAALACMLAVVLALYAHRRTATLRVAPLPRPLAARVAVPLLGAAVVALTVLALGAAVVNPLG